MSWKNPASGCVLSGSVGTLRRFAAAAALVVGAAGASAQCTGFNLAASTGASITPGTTDIGNHCDDCVNTVALPFPFTVYGVPYNSVSASSNGNIQFATTNNAYSNGCLPQSVLGIAICANWDDLRTDGTGDGIFTSVTGSAPNRVFNIEWRAHYYSGGGPTNFEVRLFEDNSKFELVYGVMDQGGLSATVGVQHSTFPPTQYSCNTGGLVAGSKLTFTCTNGPIPPTGNGAATPGTVLSCGAGGSTLLTVNVLSGFNPPSTGLAVTGNLSSIGGGVNQAFYNDGTHGDATAGDSTFSLQVTVPVSVAAGTKSVGFTVSDAEGRSTTGAMGLTVNPCPTAGPDVFVARLTDIGYYGSTGAVTAYSVGTDACNNGDVPVIWIQNGVQHPVIAQNMYRLKNGRFEQIGQSWLKHGFSSTNSGTCGTCTQPPMGSQQLGVGCSDAYGSGLNGGQGYLGPRSEVNATTGAFLWPHGTGDTGTIGMRLQVRTADVDPAQNAGAQYFAEAHYVTADDAQWTNGGNPAVNGLNNATYQAISIPNTTSAPSLIGTVHRMSPGIQAWKDADPTVSITTADYVDTSMGTPGIVARFWVAGKATDNHNGTWHYEYAVYNHNADRAGGGFSIPVLPGVGVSGVGFSGTFAHSGEPYPNTAANIDAWPAAASSGAVTWTTPEPYLPPNGANANALRWGTMYNFRFDADVAPVTGNASIALFKPGAISSVTAAGLPVPGNPPCPADFNQDGGIDGADVEAFFTSWELGDSSADFNHDGGVDGADVEAFFMNWEAGC
ncbi:MAG: hypothetical protein JSR77_09200 [Planctomycetes bacterium]|nr:hypothetical protein [Planctomycetota bacterium]